MQSLWWFCKNLPLCKCPPDNIDKIRAKCPFILRDKVCDLSNNDYRNNNENFMSLINTNFNTYQRRTTGSGRLHISKNHLGKILQPSVSLDDGFTTGGGKNMHWRDKNNNQKTFRRVSSTNCLQENASRVNIMANSKTLEA